MGGLLVVVEDVIEEVKVICVILVFWKELQELHYEVEL